MIEDMRSRLEHRMRMYTLSHLNSGNLEHHENKIKEREQLLEDLSSATRKFIKKFSSQLGQDRVNALNAEISLSEEKFMVYRESFKPRLNELKKAHSINNTVSSVIPSMTNLALSNSLQVEQNAAKKEVKAKLEDIMEDLEKLSS